MTKAKRVDLDELQQIGEGVQSRTQAHVGKPEELVKPSHDASDDVWAEYLRHTQPDLVLPKYLDAFIRNRRGEKGWTSLVAVGEQRSISATKQTVHVQFKRIQDAITAAKTARDERSPEFLTAARVAEILRRGRPVQLDPYALLTDNPESRYFQRRRIRLAYSLKVLAQSIGKINIVEMAIVQAPCVENGMIHRLGDGFGRIEAWMMADEAAGGTREKSVLEYPVCFVVECTNKEMALVVLEKNRNKENFDTADRDYSIVLMNELEHYTVNELAELNVLDKSTISSILSAWQDVPKELRAALQARKVTTYHGRQIARLKKWPTEQERLTAWLLEQVEMHRWEDAHVDDLSKGPRAYDEDGVSAGQLGMMVNSALERLQNAEKATAKLQQLREKGAVSETITKEKAEQLRSKLAKDLGKRELSKTSFEIALHDSGIRLERPKPDQTEAPKPPVSPTKYREHKREEKPIPPCMNCTLNYSCRTLDPEIRCEWGLQPDENNKCPVQPGFMGRPTRILHKCSVCGGPTPIHLTKRHGFETCERHEEASTLDHSTCIIDQMVTNGLLAGKCTTCQNDDCEIVRMLWDTAPVRLQVLDCEPERGWFMARPEMSVAELNSKVHAELDGLKERMIANRPGRGIDEVRSEFPKELTVDGDTYTLAAIYERPEEADTHRLNAMSRKETIHTEIRGGYGDPKLWGVYSRPLEDESDEKSESAQDAAEEFDPERDFEGESEHHNVAGEDA